MKVILLYKNGGRKEVFIGQPDMGVSLTTGKQTRFFDLYSIDYKQRLVYREA